MKKGRLCQNLSKVSKYRDLFFHTSSPLSSSNFQTRPEAKEPWIPGKEALEVRLRVRTGQKNAEKRSGGKERIKVLPLDQFPFL